MKMGGLLVKDQQLAERGIRFIRAVTVLTVVLQQQAEQVVAGRARQGPEVMRVGILQEPGHQSMVAQAEREERLQVMEILELKLEVVAAVVL